MSEEAREEFNQTIEELESTVTSSPTPEIDQKYPAQPVTVQQYQEMSAEERRARMERARPKNRGSDEQISRRTMDVMGSG